MRTPEVMFAARAGRDLKEKIDRSASPIHIRIARIGEKFHPLFIWLPSTLLPSKAKIVDEKRFHNSKSHNWPKPETDILENFWETLPDVLEWQDRQGLP